MSLARRTIAAVSIVLLLVACSGGDDLTTATDASRDATSSSTSSIASSPADQVDPALGQLCGVLRSARAGDVDDVRATFDHGPLHTLADAAIDVDRAVAARLLKAKEAVEADLTDPTTGVEQIAENLQTLLDAAAEAYEITGAPTRPVCEDSQ